MPGAVRIVLTAVPNERLEIGGVGTVAHVYAMGREITPSRELSILTSPASLDAARVSPSTLASWRCSGTTNITAIWWRVARRSSSLDESVYSRRSRRM